MLISKYIKIFLKSKQTDSNNAPLSAKSRTEINQSILVSLFLCVHFYKAFVNNTRFLYVVVVNIQNSHFHMKNTKAVCNYTNDICVGQEG